MKEHMRAWEFEQFRLELFDNGGVGFQGNVSYEFYVDNTLLFSESDFRPSPLHAIDSDENVFSLLGFLSLRSGDTDFEYFKDYTRKQLAWTDSDDCECLASLVFDFELGKPEEDY